MKGKNQQIKVIKAEDRQAITLLFDSELCVTEARNAERLMNLHLQRCTDLEVADTLGEIFLALGTRFQKKAIALNKQLV